MIKKHNVDQGSAEWLALREGRYTGTNADRLLKFGKGAYSLNEAAQLFQSFWTKRGHLLEQEAIGLYEDVYHIAVERVGFVTNTAFPDCGYSPDGIIGESMLIEVKCFDEERHLEAIKSLPFETLAQVHFGMLICGLPQAHVILYHPKLANSQPDKAFHVVLVKADPKIKRNLKDILRKDIPV